MYVKKSTTGKRDPKEVKLSADNPELVAIKKIASMLGPHSREQQLRILASVSSEFGYYDYAISFLEEAKLCAH